MRGEFPLARLYLQMAMTLLLNRQSDIKVLFSICIVSIVISLSNFRECITLNRVCASSHKGAYRIAPRSITPPSPDDEGQAECPQRPH